MSKEEKKLNDKIETNENTGFYTGSFLVSTPDILDPRFTKSVIYLISHNEQGAMGFIINKPIEDIHLTDLVKLQKSKNILNKKNEQKVLFGGPVEIKSGFLLHSNEYQIEDITIKINEHFSLTNDAKALQDLYEGNGPISSLFLLGYAGWHPGQLEKEILEDSWLVLDTNPDLIFNNSFSEKYNLSLELLGIENAYFSRSSGKA